MQELICNIEFDKDGEQFLAKLRTEMGGLREYNAETFEEVLSMVMLELQEEFSWTRYIRVGISYIRSNTNKQDALLNF